MNRFSVGRCCCSCDIFTDDFDRSDDTDLGDDWDEVSGAWAIVSNTLRSTATGRVLANATYSGDAVYVSMTVSPHSVLSGDVLVIVDYVDADNYHFAKMSFVFTGFAGVVNLSVGKRTSGTDSVIGGATNNVGFSAFAVLPLQVCITSDTIGATFSTLGIIQSTTPHGGNQVGLRSDSSNTYAFNNFVMSRHEETRSDCPKCLSPCTTCVTPLLLVVDLGEGGWTTDTCDACEQVAGEVEVSSLSPCIWQYLEESICDSSPTCEGETGCPQVLFYRVRAQLVSPVFPETQYIWRVTVELTASEDPACTDDCVYGASAVYESEPFDIEDCNTFPFTLAKVSESLTDACDGSLPEEITLDV